jgi:hypothetical protein
MMQALRVVSERKAASQTNPTWLLGRANPGGGRFDLAAFSKSLDWVFSWVDNEWKSYGYEICL